MSHSLSIYYVARFLVFLVLLLLLLFFFWGGRGSPCNIIACFALWMFASVPFQFKNVDACCFFLFYFLKKKIQTMALFLIKHQRQAREQILQRPTMAVYRIPRAFLLSRCIYPRSDAPGPGRCRGVRAVGVQCALYLPGAGSWVRRWQHCLSSTCSKQRPKPVRVRLRLCANCR